MIFVTVGTDHHPFTRLLEWAQEVQTGLEIEIIAQRGATPDVKDVASFDYAEIGKMEELAMSADAVVCHGGPGTIALARRCGHRPIVVPRRPDLGEHVDDHQVRYSARLAAEGGIDVANSVEDLVLLLSSERHRVDFDDEADEVVGTFSESIDDLLAGRLPRRPWRTRLLLRRSR